MTSKRDLDEILVECDACAGEDSVSYYEHFQNCPRCIDYAQEAVKFEEAIDMLREIASNPYEIARMRFWEMMRNVLEMPPAHGKQEIENILDLMNELPGESRDKIVKVRTDLFMEMPSVHRERFMGIMKDVMKDWSPDRKIGEMRSVIKASEEYAFLERMMVRKKFSELLD